MSSTDLFAKPAVNHPGPDRWPVGAADRLLQCGKLLSRPQAGGLTQGHDMAAKGNSTPKARFSASPIPLTGVRPYLSAVMLAGTLSNRKLVEALIKEADSRVISTSSTKRTKLSGASVDKKGNFFIGSIFYKEAASPAWDPGLTFKDVTHQFAWIVVRNKRAALIASDSSMRESIQFALKSAAVIPRADAFAAFVGSKARAVWLNGTHAQTDVKPESKVLMGTALEEALDPLGDHSFHLSALRSQPAIPALRSKTLGVALSSGRVWSVRAQSLADLLSDVGALFDRLDTPAVPSTSYDFLSQPVSGLVNVKDAYSVSVLPTPLLDPSGDGVGAAQITRAQEWAYETKYSVKPAGNADFTVQVTRLGTDIGTLEVHPGSSGSSVTLVGIGWQPVDPAMDGLRAEAERYLLDVKQVKVHYDSGHAISGGECYRGGFVDQLVDWKWHNFAGWDIDKEKPAANPTLAAAIGLAADQSLFGFVVQTYQQGWLACDDGSGEVGDFVHIDSVNKKVTLIHAKAASSKAANRSFSVSDYDLVIAQAIRNIRHLDKEQLLKSLRKSAGHAIADATWHNGGRVTRANFIDQVVKMGASFSKELVILQPQLTQLKHAACLAPGVSPSTNLRFKQINSLVQGAAMAAFGAGATFVAYASC